jgi:16S rRNA A1518/A1519 N6-dimethyltransferase RsmA/KsgA/DIM1 with predicted DNA glycosylase/AP lyase activity
MVIKGDADHRLPNGKWNDFFSFVSTGFSRRRKKASNALGRTIGERQHCEHVLLEMGVNPLSRSEDLGIDEWLALYKQWRV